MGRLDEIAGSLVAIEQASPKGSYEIDDNGHFAGGTFTRDEFIFLASSFQNVPWLVSKLHEAIRMLRGCRDMHEFADCRLEPDARCQLCRFLGEV